MSRWTDEYSFWNGVQIDPEMAVFLLGDNEMMKKKVPHSVLATLEHHKWSATAVYWTASAVCWAIRPNQELIVVGDEGNILAGPLGKLQEETPIEIERDEGKSGFLRCARAIGGRVYIAGMDRQVYRRIENSKWEAVDAGLPWDELEVTSIEAIDGFKEDEIYAVGRKGEIWCFDGKCWRQIDSPTNLILLGVHCAEDGFVYACGQAGIVLYGRGDKWRVVDQDNIKEDIWDIIQFRGIVYLATRNLLYEIKDHKAVPVDFGDEDIPFSFYRFAASKSSLITIGEKDVMQFDGILWSRID